MILLGKKDVLTMTSHERVAGLHKALQDVHANKIAGDFVECGVYMGGNIIIAKKFFDSVNDPRTVWAYDTFTGMTPPTDKDGAKALATWDNKAKCEAGLNLVMEKFNQHNIVDNNLRIVQGNVCETLKVESNLPKDIAILRLDTDFYDSTLSELETLYPRLVDGGYLIVDDYGHWTGCHAAVDEYFGIDFVKKNFLQLDYTGIMYQKTSRL